MDGFVSLVRRINIRHMFERLVTDMEFTFAFAIPFEPSSYLVGLALLVGTAIAAVAGFYPSREAARVPIIESLRYE
ncbi:MAG: hypothetical protein ACRDKB_01360 [Actinomycetota bacterium]